MKPLIETTEKQYGHLDYVAKDDKTHVEQALAQAKKIGKTTSKSDLTNEISRLKELLNALKEKSKSIDDAITTRTQIKKMRQLIK